MEQKETLSQEEMDEIKGGGHWCRDSYGNLIWVEDDEEDDDDTIIWW